MGRAVLAGAAVVVLALPVPQGAFAEGLNLSGSTRNRASLLKSQMALLDGRLSKQYEGSKRLHPKAAVAKGEDSVLPKFRGSYRGEYLEVARAAARAHDVPEDLFLRLVQRESGWNPYAKSNKGATGLAQLMPDTAASLGVDPSDPQQNLKGGARYLRKMYDKFGSWRLALAAYNAGPGAVEQHGGIPPYDETINYVRAIMG
ncbi:MAG: lytic transglycosylase domain-containing protein [Cypionkella sp.]|nr:lytic transglycosylase domain-containing protein [Cypionkella sp.]